MKNNNISTSVDGVSKNRETHGVSETFVAKSKIDISLEELKNQLVNSEKQKILNMHSLSHYDKVRRSVAINLIHE